MVTKRHNTDGGADHPELNWSGTNYVNGGAPLPKAN